MTIFDNLTEEEIEDLLKIQKDFNEENKVYLYLMDKLDEVSEMILENFE